MRELPQGKEIVTLTMDEAKAAYQVECIRLGESVFASYLGILRLQKINKRANALLELEKVEHAGKITSDKK